MPRDGRRVQHGWYCSDCGALYRTLGSGHIVCQKCGHSGLRGFRKRPQRVVCSFIITAGCPWTGWDDGGVNDDLGQHLRLTQHKGNG